MGWDTQSQIVKQINRELHLAIVELRAVRCADRRDQRIVDAVIERLERLCY